MSLENQSSLGDRLPKTEGSERDAVNYEKKAEETKKIKNSNDEQKHQEEKAADDELDTALAQDDLSNEPPKSQSSEKEVTTDINKCDEIQKRGIDKLVNKSCKNVLKCLEKLSKNFNEKNVKRLQKEFVSNNGTIEFKGQKYNIYNDDELTTMINKYKKLNKNQRKDLKINPNYTLTGNIYYVENKGLLGKIGSVMGSYMSGFDGSSSTGLFRYSKPIRKPELTRIEIGGN